MSSQPTLAVRVTHRFSATPERVYDAFLDPARAGRFLFATPTGQMVRAETDPRVGGRYTFVDRRDGKDVAHTGEYLELERPRRIAFTLAVTGFEESPDRISIDIVPVDGGCELTLTHEIKPEFAEYAARTEQAWSGILDALDRILSAEPRRA